MKWTLNPRFAETPDELEDDRTVAGYPLPGAVLFEIGLLLAAHLGVALAVTLVFRAFGAA